MGRSRHRIARPARVAIVGGGISGLSCAYFLLQEGFVSSLEIEISLLERAGRLGGVVRSERVGDFLLEWGPEAFVSYKPAARELVQQLGLGDQLMGSRDERRRTYVVGPEALQPLPEGMAFLAPISLRTFWLTSSLTRSGKLRALLEPLVGRSKGDPSIRSFFERRLGREFTDQIVEPLVSAIYGGDIDNLSTSSALPLLYQLEQKFGSLWRGFRQPGSRSSGNQSPLFLTLRGGMEKLIDLLVTNLKGVDVHLGLSNLRLSSESEGFRLRAPGFDGLFDFVILSTPAASSAQILADANPEASRILWEVPYTSSQIVYLAYKRSDFPHPLDGFGFVAPAGEARIIDACTWVSSKFEARCPPDSVLLRCVSHDGRMVRTKVSDEQAASLVHGEVRRLLGASCVPHMERVFNHSSVMPQLVVGHGRRLEGLSGALEKTPGLFLVGAFMGGVGIPDCIQTAQRAAQRVSAFAQRQGSLC